MEDNMTEERIVREENPLKLSDNEDGKRQLLLYVLSVPLWFVVIWLLPGSVPALALVGAVGILGLASLVAIRNLSSDLEQSIWMSLVTFSLPFWLLVIWYSRTFMIPRAQYGVAFLTGILLLFILKDVEEPIKERDWVNVCLLVGSGGIALITGGYLFSNYNRIAIETIGQASDAELALAAVFTLAMVYLTWRAVGLNFVAILLIGLGYAFLGPLMPGPLNHGGLSYGRTLRILVVEVEGFFGFLTQLTAAWIALFLLYAGLLKSYGAFGLIFKIAARGEKYIASGVAQTAVLTSAIVGSINGSQTANAGLTGAFTIPMMKDAGISSETAGGIESVASTSGQVLPPVMGAAAFVMASLVSGITYIDVLEAGLIPATILVLSIFVSVHYISTPQIRTSDTESVLAGMTGTAMSRVAFYLNLVKFGIPFLVLVYLLGVQQLTVMTSAFWTVVATVFFGVVIPPLEAYLENEDPSKAAVQSVVETIRGSYEGMVILAPVAIILSTINAIVDILMATGVPGVISLTLIDLSGGNLFVAVLLAMLICILLGLGMVTSAAYVVVALLVAPTLISQFLIPELAAHFFVFYAAILAGLTPPIATCIAVTTGISGGSFWKTSLEGLKISAPLYILPIAFIYHPELVPMQIGLDSVMAGTITLIGAIAVSYGINYPFEFSKPVCYGLSAVFLGLGIVIMIYPRQVVQFAAIGAIAVLYGIHARTRLSAEETERAPA
jgi:TRAP transporter 4TM/12TM fusion protein